MTTIVFPNQQQNVLKSLINVTTFILLIVMVILFSRFHVDSNNRIKRIYVKPFKTSESTYLVTANRMNCNRDECVAMLNGEILRIEVGPIGWGSEASYKNQAITLQPNLFSGDIFRMEPTVYLGEEIENVGWFKTAVPLSLFDNLVGFVLLAFTSLPVFWWFHWLLSNWSALKEKAPFKRTRVILKSICLTIFASFFTYWFMLYGLLSFVGAVS